MNKNQSNPRTAETAISEWKRGQRADPSRAYHVLSAELARLEYDTVLRKKAEMDASLSILSRMDDRTAVRACLSLPEDACESSVCLALSGNLSGWDPNRVSRLRSGLRSCQPQSPTQKKGGWRQWAKEKMRLGVDKLASALVSIA